MIYINQVPAVPVAVVRDGERAVLVIIGDDLSRIPESAEKLAFEARRHGDALILTSADMPGIGLAADTQAELDLRLGTPISLAHASSSGLTEIIREIQVAWPSACR